MYLLVFLFKRVSLLSSFKESIFREFSKLRQKLLFREVFSSGYYQRRIQNSAKQSIMFVQKSILDVCGVNLQYSNLLLLFIFRIFPWTLEIFGLKSYHFFKVQYYSHKSLVLFPIEFFLWNAHVEIPIVPDQ